MKMSAIVEGLEDICVRKVEMVVRHHYIKHRVSRSKGRLGLKRRIQILYASPDWGRQFAIVCLEEDLVFIEFQDDIG
jgi:hypothetical protein